jgi:hypothetical protein
MRMYPHHSQPIKYGGISRFPQDTGFTKGTATAAIVGERRLDRIEGTIAAASFLLSESEYQQLRNFAETTLA